MFESVGLNVVVILALCYSISVVFLYFRQLSDLTTRMPPILLPGFVVYTISSCIQYLVYILGSRSEPIMLYIFCNLGDCIYWLGPLQNIVII